MQTDDVLRTYDEYKIGLADKVLGLPSRHKEYPLLGSGGRFEKKAYLLGYTDGHFPSLAKNRREGIMDVCLICNKKIEWKPNDERAPLLEGVFEDENGRIDCETGVLHISNRRLSDVK